MQAAVALISRMTTGREQQGTSTQQDTANPNPTTSYQEENASVRTAGKQKRKLEDSVAEETASSEKKKLFACYICDELRGRLDRHLQAVHRMEKETAKARAKAQKASTDRGQKVLSCPECGKIVRYLADHLNNVHQIRRGTDASLDQESQTDAGAFKWNQSACGSDEKKGQHQKYCYY